MAHLASSKLAYVGNYAAEQAVSEHRALQRVMEESIPLGHGGAELRATA
jgi:hypothetical protein